MPIRESALYPPPSSFSAAVGEAELLEALARSNDDPIPKPVSLAVSLPGGPASARDADLARLHREIDGLTRHVARDRGVAELLIDASAVDGPLRQMPLQELIAAIERQLYVGPEADRVILVEARGRALEPEDIGALRAAGFSRLAIGGSRAFPGIVRTARLTGFRSVAMTVEPDERDDGNHAIRHVADAAISHRPGRLEVPATAAAPGRGQVFAEAIRSCVEYAGYRYIGPDQYALTDDDLAIASRAGRVRLGVYGYTAAPDCDLLGAGPGALSQVGSCLGRNAGLPGWRRAVDTGRLPALDGFLLSLEDRIRGAVIQSLLCRQMIPIRELESEFGFTFRRRFALELAIIARLPAAEHMRDTGDRIEVRSPGWPWLRNMAECFDLYASQIAPVRGTTLTA